MKRIIVKISKLILLFAIVLISACDKSVDYGFIPPYAKVTADGHITDGHNNGIPGVRVVLTASPQDPNYSQFAPWGASDTLWTNENGKFYGSLSEAFSSMSLVKMQFDDIDGVENGGEFHNVEKHFPVHKIREGEGMCIGEFNISASVIMGKK